MTEACPLPLNYGHFGLPSYDVEKHEWHFPRLPGRIRELKQVGQPVIALRSPLRSPLAHIQSAVERSRNVRHLTHQYPEALPASALLPGLAQVSEVVENVTSSHDPVVSELLAIGEAIDPDKSLSHAKRAPIVAIAGGDAGEIVRLILLANEKLGWEGSKSVQLSSFSSKDGEEGWWSGSGSPVQQLVFADAEGGPSSWLAVRYPGAVSVLRPQLRRNPDALSLAYAASTHNPPSRLDANHIATLSIAKTNSAPYSDVAFNPWHNQQIATIDQKGAWAVWDIEKKEKHAKEIKVWTIEKFREGNLSEVLPEGESPTPRVADGWGKVLWAGNDSTIVVARRSILAVFDIEGDPKQISTPNLLSKTTAECILDVKQSLQDSSQIFVATTSSIFWLQVVSSARNHEGEDMVAGAKCLLSWIHFRNSEDLSLSLQVADDFDRGDDDNDGGTITVLFYSRLTGVTNVFAFQYTRSNTKLVPSTSDPYLLRLPSNDSDVPVPRKNAHVSQNSSGISAISLKAVKYESPIGSISSDLGQTHIEKNIVFYQLSLLTNNLTLYECLYADVKHDFTAELRPPELVRRVRVAKSPAKTVDDFIVPDGYVDREDEDLPDISSAEEQSNAESEDNLGSVHEDPYTISFEWLESEIHDRLTDVNLTTNFRDHLDFLLNMIEDSFASGVSTMKLLLSTEDFSLSVLDLDKAASEFVDFLDDIRRLATEYDDGGNAEESRQLMVSSILTPKLEAGLGIRDAAALSLIYEHLVQTWIGQLPRQIPGRVRIASERALRDVAGQICLASFAMRINSGARDKNENDQPDPTEASAPYVLPVRKRNSSMDFGKGKERSDAVPSPSPASSPTSKDVGSIPPSTFAASPTPGSTPSLRSVSSVSSLTSSEDPATQRLRAYASLAPQPSLPPILTDLLGQWQVGSDPTEYDWVAAHPFDAFEDESEDNVQKKQRQQSEERRKKRLKRQNASTIEPSSQPEARPLVRSQPQQDQYTQNMQGSSQQTERAVTMSQVELGKFGGRLAKNKKLKIKDRPAGFK